MPARWFPVACAVAVAIGLLFPIAWMLSTAIKPHSEVFTYPPVWLPTHITFAGFAAALRGDMLGFLLNSLWIATCTALLSTVAGAFAAYPISRRRSTATRAALGYLIASIAFPAPLLLISTYIVSPARHHRHLYHRRAGELRVHLAGVHLDPEIVLRRVADRGGGSRHD